MNNNIGYVAPKDLFNGRVKAGTIYVPLDSSANEFEPQQDIHIALCRLSYDDVKEWEQVDYNKTWKSPAEYASILWQLEQDKKY
jgi:hypothetical protein